MLLSSMKLISELLVSVSVSLLSQISASEKLLSVLNNLYQRGVLDRFVIDEAHCVSQACLAITGTDTVLSASDVRNEVVH